MDRENEINGIIDDTSARRRSTFLSLFLPTFPLFFVLSTFSEHRISNVDVKLKLDKKLGAFVTVSVTVLIVLMYARVTYDKIYNIT